MSITDQYYRDRDLLYMPRVEYLRNPPIYDDEDENDSPDLPTSDVPVNIYNTSGGGGGIGNLDYSRITPKFDSKGMAAASEYGPGGMYEVNPSALGFQFGPQGQVLRAGPVDYMQGQLAPGGEGLFNSNLKGQIAFDGKTGLGGLTLEDIAGMYDARMQNIPGQNFRNFLKGTRGAMSNYAEARAPGSIQELLSKIPSLSGILTAIGGNKDRSDTSRYAVDNVGFGQGTQRDQFGVFTGGQTLLGDTASYEERMQDEIEEIAENFGYNVEDLYNLNPETLDALRARNNFKGLQVIDYVNKLQGKKIERRAKEQAAAAAEEAAFNERVAREAETAARARAQNQAVYESADRQGFTNDQGGFSTSAADRAGTSEGSGQFSSKSSRGRQGYMMGGPADGGIVRVRFQGGGADMGAPERAEERAERGYGDTSPVDDRGSDRQNDVQAMVNAGFTPVDIRRMTGTETILDKVKTVSENPAVRSLVRGGLYALNPALAGIDARTAMNVYDAFQDAQEDAEKIGIPFNQGGLARILGF